MRRIRRSKARVYGTKSAVLWRKKTVLVSLDGVRGFHDPIVAGQVILRKALAAQRAKDYQAERPVTVHVKDGKPLTEHGAKLLGVPWPIVVQ